jgi:Fe-S cluster biogenesis protein NfuA
MEKKIIEIYAESTPNPNTMKFVTNVLVNARSPIEFNDPSSSQESPLAQKLFQFPFIKSVFLSGNYLTLSKPSELDWYDVLSEVRDFIKNYLQEGNPVFSDDRNNLTGKDPSPLKINLKSEVEIKIHNVLEEYIRPAVEQDGGAIEFLSFKEGVVKVAMKGACSGCPSSTMTLKAGIEGLLKRMVPEVNTVVAESR